jgi:hypothetical protein
LLDASDNGSLALFWECAMIHIASSQERHMLCLNGESIRAIALTR